MDILIFIVHSGKAVTIKKLSESVLDASVNTVRAWLKDLIEAGYVERESVWTFMPTNKAKQLFGAQG